MSVSREIKIRVATRQGKFSSLFSDFVFGFWLDDRKAVLSTLEVDDVDDHNFKNFSDWHAVKSILDVREHRGLDNFINIIVPVCDNEMISIVARKKTETYQDCEGHYELIFTPGVGKRIEGTIRYTDYGFYLNQIIPRLTEIGCYVCEVACHDFDC